MGPTVSSELLSGNTPFRLTLPNVGFRPTIPHNPAGILIEPPVSVPRDPMHNPPETAAADPLLDPPVIFMVFQGLWQRIAEAIPDLRSYPRIVGETGGKDFVVAHPDSDEQGLLVALLRGSFEYQGQKCSAASRAYVPKSVWGRMGEPLCDEVRKITMGDARDFTNFMTAVIDQRAFDIITGYIERAQASDICEVVVGGVSDDNVGWFIEPTIIVTSDPNYESMVEEIFGPVLTVFIYEDDDFEGVLKMCDGASPYALTGSIFATQEADIQTAFNALRFTAGNFYINDKPTGAVVGQQPFGGSRASGTNDKAGSELNL